MNGTHGSRHATLALMILLMMPGLVLGRADSSLAQAISPPFDTDYSLVTLGSVPGVPPSYGGLTFESGDPDTILIGGSANNTAGNIYSIGVMRDGTGHISGFAGTAQLFATAAYNDGGVTYGPSGVLFLARWPVNQLGQVKPGSSTTDKIIDMAPFGVVSSLSAMAFVPAGFPGAGHLKLVTYGSGDWYDATLADDGTGTFDVTGAEHRTQIAGAPEGFVYIPPASPQFPDYSKMLVAEYGNGEIVAYDVDANGDPTPLTRTNFLTGLSGAEGAVVDPLTGDFLFSTFGGASQVVAVHGFGVPTGCAACATAPNCTDTCDQDSGECRTCGHPFSNRRCVVNAVVVLQGALDLRTCEPCLCDVDLNGTVTATDALMVLKSCARIDVALQCALPTTGP